MYSLVYSRFKQPLGFGQRCAFGNTYIIQNMKSSLIVAIMNMNKTLKLLKIGTKSAQNSHLLQAAHQYLIRFSKEETCGVLLSKRKVSIPMFCLCKMIQILMAIISGFIFQFVMPDRKPNIRLKSPISYYLKNLEKIILFLR